MPDLGMYLGCEKSHRNLLLYKWTDKLQLSSQTIKEAIR